MFGLEGGARAEELSERIQAFLNDPKFNLGNLGNGIIVHSASSTRI